MNRDPGGTCGGSAAVWGEVGIGCRVHRGIADKAFDKRMT